MRFPNVLAGGIALLAVLWMLSGLIGGEEASPGPGAEEAQGAGGPVKVRTLDVEASAQPQFITLQGETVPMAEALIAARTPGEIAEIPVVKGDFIEAGTLLVKLAEEDRRAALTEARALLEERQIAFEAAEELGQQGFRSELGRAEAASRLEQARAAVSRAELELERTTIRSPIAGTVNDIPVEIGDFVNVGDPVAAIVTLDPIRITVDVAERDVADLRVGGTAMVTVLDRPAFPAEISFISAVADPDTRTFRVELTAPNPARRILAGQSASIDLPVEERSAHLISPALLALTDEGAIGVKIVTPDDEVAFLPVELLADSPDGVWVSGLPERARIISVGQDYVRPGQQVEAIDAASLDVQPAIDAVVAP